MATHTKCCMCGQNKAGEKTLNENGKAHLVAIGGPWVTTALHNSGAGLETDVALSVCRCCENYYRNHVKCKSGVDHLLLTKKNPRAKSVIPIAPLSHDGVSMVRSPEDVHAHARHHTVDPNLSPQIKMLVDWKAGRRQAQADHLPAAPPPPRAPTYNVGQHVNVYKNMAPHVHIVGGPGQIIQAKVVSGIDTYDIKYTHGGTQLSLTVVSGRRPLLPTSLLRMY